MTASLYQIFLSMHGFAIGVSVPGSCYDYVPMESHFGTYKAGEGAVGRGPGVKHGMILCAIMKAGIAGYDAAPH